MKVCLPASSSASSSAGSALSQGLSHGTPGNATTRLPPHPQRRRRGSEKERRRRSVRQFDPSKAGGGRAGWGLMGFASALYQGLRRVLS